MALFDSHPRYTIAPEPLGAGGMGTVFRGFDKKSASASRNQSDKCRRPQGGGREALQAQASMAHMQHPYICPIHDYDRIDGHPYS